MATLAAGVQVRAADVAGQEPGVALGSEEGSRADGVGVDERFGGRRYGQLVQMSYVTRDMEAAVAPGVSRSAGGVGRKPS